MFPHMRDVEGRKDLIECGQTRDQNSKKSKLYLCRSCMAHSQVPTPLMPQHVLRVPLLHAGHELDEQQTALDTLKKAGSEPCMTCIGTKPSTRPSLL